MELTWALAGLCLVLAGLAALFAKAWIAAKAELATLQAEQLSHQRESAQHALMKAEFEALSRRLLSERTEELTAQHSQSLSQVLQPLTRELDEFKKRVNEVYERETRDRQSLRGEILSLKDLNQRMADEAHKLTRALKGDNKIAGNWGELVLDQVLSSSGLRDGHEYHRQVSLTGEDGQRLQPDVVISLPDQKCLVIDAKLSLKDYEQAVSATDDLAREAALTAHVNSLKAHIRGLSNKHYAGLAQLTTVDFVIMFVPIEPAFSVAFEKQPALFSDALKQNVVIASPSTLLALLRTVEHVWRIEHQNKNTQEIAELGGKLYDQFALFADSFQEVGDRIDKSQEAYQRALSRLSTGRGNLLRRAEQLRALGVTASRQIPAALVDRDA